MSKTNIVKPLGIVISLAFLAFNVNIPGTALTSRQIDGYQRAKWGMSPDEVKEVFPTQSLSPLEKIQYFSDEYLGELLTEDLVSTFSFIDIILKQHTVFEFSFHRNQLYKIELCLSPSLDDSYFEWFWEVLEEKYRQPTTDKGRTETKNS